MNLSAVCDRRGFLRAAGACLGLLVLAGRKVRAAFEVADQPPPEYSLEDRLLPILAGRQPAEGRVLLEMPELAEDGRVVPVTIVVDSPMTEQHHVQTLYLFVERNPDPLIFALETGPALGAAEWNFKIRMRETSTVRAIAEMNDGTLYEARTDVSVTMSGCG